MRPPAFWNDKAGRSSGAITRALLSPLGWAYAAAAASRIARTTPTMAGIPVICVGNLTLGGTGKTPVSAALLAMLDDMGAKPFALSRGWGGNLKGPIQVDAERHTADEVGDEPLLLARSAPAIISADRPAGAELARKSGAGIVVMDDGHQNPTLYKDFSFVVVDGETGWGPGTIFPAGPLREPVATGLARANAVIVMMPDGEAEPDLARLKLDTLEIPVFRAWLAPTAPVPQGRLLAFAGIGRPQKFFDGLKAAGGDLADAIQFPDHHRFTAADLRRLADLAQSWDARLITTTKDHVRLPADMRANVLDWPVQAVFADTARIRDCLQEVLSKAGSA
ncbi:MAG: tetraacyldisaccharide 4'-kinase [Caulobacterales bacterium]|uniref:tetraacyldisaccharide 4'-kinase n=1 Tax=Glycocaulis sp. TaxID=1969725 RepID=UPI003F9FAB89